VSFGHRATSSLAQSTQLELVLPPEVSFASATGGGVHAGGTVTWALGTLQPGQIGVRQVTATVPGGLAEADLLAARARIVDTSPANEARARTVTRVQSDAPLQLQLVASPDPVQPGETQDVELVVSNRGAFPVFDTIVELVVPDEVADFNEEVASGGPVCVIGVSNNGACDARERLVWSLDQPAPGAGRTLRVPPQVVMGLVDGTIVSWRAFAEGSLASAEAGAATIVKSARRLDLGLVESIDPVGAGEALTYAVSFGHLATASLAPGAVLELLLPSGVTGVSASDGGTLQAGGIVRWTLGELQPGQSGVRNARVTVPGATAEAALLGAQARIVDTASPPNEARTRAITRVRSEGPLRLELVATPDPVRPGETQDVELVVSNRGAFPIFDAAVELVVPDEIADFNEELANGAPACVIGVVNNGACDARERLVWDVGQIAAGTGRALRVAPQVLAGIANGTLVGWRAAAEALDDGVSEFSEAGAFPIVQAAPRFDLAVVESADPIAGGQQLTYTIHFGHRGSPALPPGSRLELVLPPGTTFRSASKGGVHAGGTINWWLGPMVPGVAGQRRATVSVPGGAGAQAALLPARVRIWEASSLASESRARTVTRVRSQAPVALQVVFPTSPIEQGQVLTAKLTVTNRTASTLFDVDVEAVVPDGVQSFSPLQTDGGSCVIAVSNNGLCDPRERIVWTIPQITAGASVELDLLFTVVSGASELADGNILALQALVDGSEEQAGGLALKPIPEPAHWPAATAVLLTLAAMSVRERRSCRRRAGRAASPSG